jgi:hypothetical protein
MFSEEGVGTNLSPLDNISRCLFDKMAFDKFITLDVSRDCYSG